LFAKRFKTVLAPLEELYKTVLALLQELPMEVKIFFYFFIFKKLVPLVKLSCAKWALIA